MDGSGPRLSAKFLKMSVLFQLVTNSAKVYALRKTWKSSLPLCNCLFTKKYSDVPKRIVTFDEVAAQRRAEARRSLVIQVNSESSFSELYGYCSKYASIKGVHHYKSSDEEHFMVIEFESEDNLKEIVRSCSGHQKDAEVMALQSPFLWFRAVNGKKEKYCTPNASLIITNGTEKFDEDMLFDELLNCKTVSDQIQLLHDRTVLNNLGVRLRYIVARQLEMLFESMYANIAVRPFGSSVNGFGKMGCDLDLVVTNELDEKMYDPEKRLIYHEKKSDGGRSPWYRHMELLAAMVELRCAGATRAQRILHARVPILKCAHALADLDLDLCYNNMSGVYMSELLYLYGSLDARVRPLACLARRWAQTAGLTNPHPGRWITNFPLTLMVLFFLQQTKQGAVLPTLKYLVRKAGKEDVRLTEDQTNCTFLRDPNKLPSDSYGQNQSSLETLLLQFFEFYAQFDFQEKAISIVEGVPIRKPDVTPLYIVNPLEQTLNVSRNVSFEECERLKAEVRNAAWQLESCMEGNKEEWGILGLIEKKSSRSLKRLLRAGNSHRLVSVKDLFQDQAESTEESLKSKLKRLTPNSDKMESAKEIKNSIAKEAKKDTKQMKFKNTQVANEVQRIRRNKMV